MGTIRPGDGKPARRKAGTPTATGPVKDYRVTGPAGRMAVKAQSEDAARTTYLRAKQLPDADA